jgi:hypothetical protein
MKPDSIETILKKARRAQLAVFVCAIVWPFLFIWTIDLIARRKEFRNDVFWFIFFCTAGIWIALYFWVTRTFRAVVGTKNHVSKIESHLDYWLHIGVIIFGVMSFLLMLADKSFGAWPNVRGNVIFCMLLLPTFATCALTLAFTRMIVLAEKKRTIPLRIGTTSSQIVELCSALLFMIGAVFGGGMTIQAILRNGQVLSLHNKMVYRSVSPEVYWTYTELYIFVIMMMFVLSIAPLVEVIAQEKRRQSTRFQKLLLWGIGFLFSVLLVFVVWTVYENS